ncbi:MAG: pyridoxal phosphate-dependent aminotransferase [Oscillospiraceae bacterium]|nr:pyridoxal phosphate-dependent aminotransferase [Oscillospiraceae bacterium]
MKELSRTASAVKASTTLAIASLAKEMQLSGIDVVGFGTGEPDFRTPENICEAAHRAIDEGKTKYTPAAGIPALRQAVADRLREDFGLDYKPAQIVVASGAKHNVYIMMAALLNPGDEVIVPAPYWVTYEEVVRMNGGIPVSVCGSEENLFKITPEQLEEGITERTKLFMINNPCNPTGTLYTEDELRALCAVCVKHDLYIMADEIYAGLVYDGQKFVSVASLGEEIKERTILITGVSKSYAMTGWRIGYAAANEQIAQVMANYVSHSTGAPSTISQIAAVEALNGPQDTIYAMRDVFEKRRNYFVDRVSRIEGVSCVKPEGAFYIMMNISAQRGRILGGREIRSGDDFALSLLEQEHVAVVPCSGFGAPDYVRWTYAASLEEIREGLDRLERFLKEKE